MPGKSPITQQDAEQMLARVDAALREAQARAAKSGKPLLILIGEEHYRPECALAEAMICKRAKELGIKDISFELSREDIPQLKDEPLLRSNLHGTLLTNIISEYYKTTKHYVDDYHTAAILQQVDPLKPDYKVAERDAGMVKHLSEMKHPVIALVGADHLKGMLPALKAKNTHTIVAFDVSPGISGIMGELTNPFLKGATPAPAPATTNAAAPSDVEPVRIYPDGEAKSLTLEKLLEYGLGGDAKGFTDWLRTNKRLPPLEFCAIVLKRFADDKTDNGYIMRATTLYEMGRDKEGGKELGTWLYKMEKELSGLDEREHAVKVKAHPYGQFLQDAYLKSAYSTQFLEGVKEGLTSARHAAEPMKTEPGKAAPTSLPWSDHTGPHPLPPPPKLPPKVKDSTVTPPGPNYR